MSDQQSQKSGMRSDAQKTATARHDYEPMPAANPVAGAFGKQPQTQSDQDLALSLEEKRRRAEKPDDTSE